MLVSYRNITRRHNPENLNLKVHSRIYQQQITTEARNSACLIYLEKASVFGTSYVVKKLIDFQAGNKQ
jgi:hypothetical protein